AHAGRPMDEVHAQLRKWLSGQFTVGPSGTGQGSTGQEDALQEGDGQEDAGADEVAWRLRALWALHVTGGADAELLRSLLDDAEPRVRGWAIQFALEDSAPSDEFVERMAGLAKEDPSPRVRLYLASALQRLPLERRWEIAEGLVQHPEDVGDHNLELMYWYGI